LSFIAHRAPVTSDLGMQPTAPPSGSNSFAADGDPRPSEALRLQQLYDLLVLDTPAESLFDEIVQTAATITGTPIALVSLVDEHRQWFKAVHGLDCRETARELAFCDYTIRSDDLLEVEDAHNDARFRDNPLVTGSPHIRFYAGAPLVVGDGLRIGTLCTIDTTPRRLEAWQRSTLVALGRLTVAALRHRRRNLEDALQARSWLERELEASNTELNGILDQMPIEVSHVDRNLSVRYMNRPLMRTQGEGAQRLIGAPLERLIGTPTAKAEAPHHVAVLAGEAQRYERKLYLPNGQQRHLTVHLVPDRRGGEVAGFYSFDVDETAQIKAERQIARAAQRFQRLYERSPALLCAVGADGRVMNASQRLLDWLGFSRDQMLGRRWQDFLRPSGSTGSSVVEDITGHTLERSPFLARSANGGLLNVEVSSAQEYDENDRPHVLLVLTDVTDRDRFARELAAQSERLEVTLTCIADAVITTDLRGCILFANQAAETWLGLDSGQISGLRASQLLRLAPADEPTETWCLDTALKSCLRMGREHTESGLALMSPNCRDTRTVRLAIAPMRRPGGDPIGCVMVLSDMSEQHRLTRELAYRASHDSLTGLLNRGAFEQCLAAVLAERVVAAREHVMLYVDLDQFKVVNDLSGHSVGDRLLVEVAAAFRSWLRVGDIAARLGGDEFGVVLRNCGRDMAHALAESLCQQLNDLRFAQDGRRFRIGASIGLVLLEPGRWGGTAEVLKAADVSCFGAKEAGRNRVHIYRDEDVCLQQRCSDMDWVTRIEHAIEEDRLLLYYQEIRGLAEPGSQHAEILVRMLSETRSVLLPGAFMGAAERFRVATRIDRWVIHNVLRTMREHPQALARFSRIAINLSGQSLDDFEFHGFLREILAEHHLLCGRLCFEVTETSVVNNIQEASRLLADLRGLGCAVALDDFGSGASSFGYLRTLAVDYLKIDQQFVRGLATDAVALATVRCIQDVAGIVGMRTIAEGIETESTGEMVRSLGVHYAQGYHFHRPEPVTHLLERHAEAHPAEPDLIPQAALANADTRVIVGFG